MLNLFLSLGSIVFMVAVFLILKINFWLTCFISFIGGLGLFLFLGKKIQKRLEFIFNDAADHMRKQQFEQAIIILQRGYNFSKWQFLVKGSIDGQIGVIHYLCRKNDKAKPLLASAGFQHYIAKIMLAIILYKGNEKKKAKEVFESIIRYSRKESLVYAVYAYILNEINERSKAMAILNDGLAICKNDERLLINLNALRNNKSMKMKVFGDQWYQFMLERPMIRQEQPSFARVSKRMVRG